jgi:sugar lactone lactonase YvrE
MRMRLMFGPALFCALPAVLLSGCSGGGSQPSSTAVPPASTQSRVASEADRSLGALLAFYPPLRSQLGVPRYHDPQAGWRKPATGTTLYVSNLYAGNVTSYDATMPGSSPTGTITTGIDGPEGLAVDASGNLYVCDNYNNTVTVYAPGGTSPTTTYSNGISFPVAVAVDTSGTVYVANANGFSFTPGSIVEYAGGSMSPTTTITNTAFQVVNSIGLDSSNNLYVTYMNSNEKGLIEEFAQGSTKGTNLKPHLGFSGGIAVDTAGNIVVSDQSLPGIEIFKPGQRKRTAIFAKKTGATLPLAFNNAESQLFAGSVGGNAVYVYSYPAHKPAGSFTTGVAVPAGVAISPAAP